MKRVFLLTIALFFAFGLSGCSYNDLTAKQQNVKGAWADVESQLQRRADLIPNIIKIAQTAAVQEQEVFGQAVIDAANSFGGTVGRLLSLQENYPQLRSNELFMKAQDELSGTENRIATKREDYNKVVTDYNTTRNSFPAVLTASLMGFKEEPYFKAQEGAQNAPTVPDPNSIRRNQPAPANQ
jgi:LemA protein